MQGFHSSLLLTITDVTGVFMRQDNTLGMFIASTHVEISDVISRYIDPYVVARTVISIPGFT